MKNKNDRKFNIGKLKKMWKNKRGRAIIELSCYMIFFFIVIIFSKVASGIDRDTNVTNNNVYGFINDIVDNYEYSMNIKINDNNYIYNGKVLGNNSSIERIDGNEREYFYVMNNRLYELDDDGNYILTSTDFVYPYINYNYLNFNNIRNFINGSTVSGDTYIVKISDIVLNSNSNDTISIMVDNDRKYIEIDYSNLFLNSDSDIESCVVSILFSNINNIMSLKS